MKRTYLLIILLLLVTTGFAFLKFQVLHTPATITTDPHIITPPFTQTAATSSTGMNEPVSSGMTLSVNSPANNSTVTTTTVKVTGTTKAGAQVFVNDTELKADAKGAFSTTVTVNDGDNEIFIAANDDVGNYAEKSVVVQYIAP